MKLSKVLCDIDCKLNNFIDLEINHISMNTNDITKNTLFFCIKGQNQDSHDLAELAIQKGAIALVVERLLDVPVPQIVVNNTREVVGKCAENFYHNPRKNFQLIGVTGTNGKTTTTYMIKNILEMAGYKVGVIGTIGVVIDQQKSPANLTTPDPIELHKIFYDMVQQEIDFVVMEVSAHSIDLQKISGLVFDVGILTNVTQDHLDYFGTFQNYLEVKKEFLTPKFCKVGVVNVDDVAGLSIVMNNPEIPLLTYGLKNPADCFATKINYTLNGTTYFLNIQDNLNAINTRLIGEFNVYNAMGAGVACTALGINQSAIKAGLSTCDFVEGRFNVVMLANGAYAVIDYAHTPDGIENILSSVRKVTKGKIYSLFGCGGNRDTSKRSIMGKISAKLADFTIITSDNPRYEEPNEIIKDIEKGVKSLTSNYICIENRKMAINYALRQLNKGDVVVVAGKGAENYLDIKGQKIPYSDTETISSEYEKIQLEAVKW